MDTSKAQKKKKRSDKSARAADRKSKFMQATLVLVPCRVVKLPVTKQYPGYPTILFLWYFKRFLINMHRS